MNGSSLADADADAETDADSVVSLVSLSLPLPSSTLTLFWPLLLFSMTPPRENSELLATTVPFSAVKVYGICVAHDEDEPEAVAVAEGDD